MSESPAMSPLRGPHGRPLEYIDEEVREIPERRHAVQLWPSGRVWVIAERAAWEGHHLRSVHATREGAEQEAKLLPEPYGEWVILEYEVNP